MRKIDIVIGAFFGDEGKGATVDERARRHKVATVVRFGGGNQPGHMAVDALGRSHVFNQFGSGTLAPGIRTHLSSQMYVNISNLLTESESLAELGIGDALTRTTIDPNCRLIMPHHALICRLAEAARGPEYFGTTGLGVGEAVAEWQEKGEGALLLRDAKDAYLFRTKVQARWAEKVALGRDMAQKSEYPEVGEILTAFLDYVGVEALIDRHLRFVDDWGDHLVADADFFAHEQGALIFEGTQGALLDCEYGFWPHVTKTSVILAAAKRLLAQHKVAGEVTAIGVMRGYATRHGKGPFLTENDELRMYLAEPHHENNNTLSGKFRLGWLDLPALRYGLAVNTGIDVLAVTNLDRMALLPEIKVCTAYQYLGEADERLDEFFEWQDRSGQVVIRGIKRPAKPTPEGQMELTRHLRRCIPLEFRCFPAWPTTADWEVDLPGELTTYLDFLEAELSMPIGSISLGPTANGRCYLLDH